jgi:hypothetical protein
MDRSAAIYARVSSDQQKENHTIQSQTTSGVGIAARGTIARPDRVPGVSTIPAHRTITSTSTHSLPILFPVTQGTQLWALLKAPERWLLQPE